MSDTAPTQEEQWDDSELLTSWNEAFAEYKKYHSIAANGGKVDPPAAVDTPGLTDGDKPSHATDITKQVQDETADSDDYDPSVGQASKGGQAADAAGTQSSAAAGGAAMPQLLAANIQDDNMKNLMMSWYYAGYYTGLYEGKQQGYASALQHGQEGG